MSNENDLLRRGDVLRALAEPYCGTPGLIVENLPATAESALLHKLKDECGYIDPPSEAAGCVPCLRCGGFRAPGEWCAIHDCYGGLLWSEAKIMRDDRHELKGRLAGACDRIEELRRILSAALHERDAARLPKDARELIAEALSDALFRVGGQNPCECECPDDEPRPYRELCIPCRMGPQFVADAILAALGKGGST
jgi:hypothetical protein